MCTRSFVVTSLLVLVPLSATARFHLWQITEVYSNADGSVQFVELANNADLEDLTATHTVASNSETYTIPSNLGTTSTANHHLLFATPAYASAPGAVPPDFTFNPLAPPSATFMSRSADTINFGNGLNTFSYAAGELPTNGELSLNEAYGSNVRTVASNSPTNFAGQIGHLPEPSGWLTQLAGAAAVFALARTKRTHPA